MAQAPESRRLSVHPVFRKEPPHPALDYRPPRSLRLIKAATVSFISFASVSILYVLWWFFLATSLQDGVQKWITVWREDGLVIESARMEVDGFPFSLRLSVTTPSVTRADGLSWSAPILIAQSRPMPFSDVTIRTSGRQTLTLALEDGLQTYVGEAGLIEVTTDSLTDTPRNISLMLRDVLLENAEHGAMGASSGKIRFRRYSPENVDHKTITGDATIIAKDARFPTGMALPLGESLQSIDARFRLLGGIADAPIAEALVKWRDDGGTVEIGNLDLRYGPLSLAAAGTLALDENLQPVGAGTAKAQGFFETVDALRVRGYIDAKPALTAKLVLGALSRKSPNGGAPILTIPLSIQNQMLHVGPVPFLTLPDVLWPGFIINTDPAKIPA